MLFNDVIHYALNKGINPNNKDRTTIIHEIQIKEGFIPCYRTNKVDCKETGCLWWRDCRNRIHIFEVVK